MACKNKLGIIAFTLCGALPLVAGAANAQGVCGERKSFLDRLAREYNERPSGIGLQADGSVMELLTAPTGSWSLIITTPAGLTCVVSSGDGWKLRDRQAGRDA